MFTRKKTIGALGRLSLLAVLFAPTALSAGLSQDEALSLTADLILIQFESQVNNCEAMGAKNMDELHAAMRKMSEMRLEAVPNVTTESIEKLKVRYRNGLAELSSSTVTKEDHIELICKKTYEKITGIGAAEFMQRVQGQAH